MDHHFLLRDMNSNTILHLAAASGAAHLVDALIRLEGYVRKRVHEMWLVLPNVPLDW